VFRCKVGAQPVDRAGFDLATKMKKISHIAAFLLLLTSYSYGQNADIQTTTVKGQGNAMDTIITRTTYLSFGESLPNNYKRDESMVQALRPYLVADIADPSNLTDPIYLAHIKDAREKLPLAKAELLDLMKASKSYAERMAKFNITNEADLNSITFVHIPRYYITPNIVSFKNGENIAKYYNLAGSGLQYLAFRNNRLFGYLDFNEKKSRFKSEFIPALRPIVEAYDQIVKLGKTPIALNTGVSTDPKNVGAGGHVHMFGYVDQGHLVFSYCEEGVIQKAGTDAYVAPDPHFYKKYTLETAESFFSGDGSRSTIKHWLDNAVNSLKYRL